MSSFFWLLLYLAPLLGLTAVIFGWLGWRWSGSDLKKRIAELEKGLLSLSAAEQLAEQERDAAQAEVLSASQEAANLLRKRNEELARVQGELESAHSEARRRRDETAKTQESLRTQEAEINRLLADLDAAREEIQRLRTAPPIETPVGPDAPEPPPEKPKRKRTSATKTKPVTAHRGAAIQDTLATLEERLSSQQSTLEVLSQELEDWQRRVATLEAQPTADPAGLALAYRSLADSEKRLQEASADKERMQSQVSVLKKVSEAATALEPVPDDDLTRIKGIKNVISDQLRSHGIRTWRQIALWNDDELRTFSELLAFRNRATREKWKQQARELHESVHGPLT
jgi:predicted flap endonuclease-1-like 5' DNA nuclease